MLGEIDGFYWVAGRVQRGKFNEASLSDILATIDVNFRNVIPIIHTIWMAMQRLEHKCKFVVIASTAGKKAKAGEAAYVSSKFAQVGFVRSLGIENQNPNLTVTLVLPGGMKTALWDKYPNSNYDSFLDPTTVAAHIVKRVECSDLQYQELEIPRGAL